MLQDLSQQHFNSILSASHIMMMQCPSMISDLLCYLLIKLSYFWKRLKQQFFMQSKEESCYPKLNCERMQFANSLLYFFSYQLRTYFSFCQRSDAFYPSYIIYFFSIFQFISLNSSINHFESLNSSLSLLYSEIFRVSKNLKISRPQ